MPKLPALRIVDALAGHGESANPVYAERNLLPIWATRFKLQLEVASLGPVSAKNNQTYVIETEVASPGSKLYKKVAERTFHDPITFPLKLELSKKHMVEGESHIRIKVYINKDKIYESKPVSFTIDKRHPLSGARPPTPIVDEDLYNGPGVTEDYLKRHCDVVKVGIPGYPDSKKGDSVSILFGPINPPVVVTALIDIRGGETVVVLHRSVFELLSNGVYLLHYILKSRSGAQSDQSTGKFIRVNLPPSGSKS